MQDCQQRLEQQDQKNIEVGSQQVEINTTQHNTTQHNTTTATVTATETETETFKQLTSVAGTYYNTHANNL